MAPRPTKDAAMALLTSAPARSVPRCARCISLATRPLFPQHSSTNQRRSSPISSTTCRLPQRRSYASKPRFGTISHGRVQKMSPGEEVDMTGRVRPSEPFDPDQPMPADGKDIAIVGGGLTGLTAAYYMASVVKPSTKITLYEASPRLGGWIRTDQVPVDVDGKKGIVNFERGPRSLSSLSTNTGRFDDLVFYDMCIRLGLKPQVAPNLPRYLFYPDHLVPVPTSLFKMLSALMTEELWQKTLPRAAFGYLKHVLAGKPMPKEEQSISEFLLHICDSPAVADNMMSGMIHGIYGGDIDKLSAHHCLYPMFENMFLKKAMGVDVVANSIDVRTLACFVGDPAVRSMAKDVANKKGALLHFGSEGLQALPNAIEAALRSQPNVKIKTSTPLRKLEYSRGSKKVQVTEKTGVTKRFDKVYSTIGSHDLERIVPGKLRTLGQFESVSIMAVNLWFPQPYLKPQGFGYLIPRSVSKELNPHHALGVFFDSDIGNNHPDEPEGTKLFVLMGGHHYEKPDVKIPTPDEAIKQARDILERQLRIPASLPCHAEANFSHNCIPQHHLGHESRIRNLHEELEEQFEGRLLPVGGSFSRIGGMAAIRDGWLAGTMGLDPSKPLHENHMKAGWEGMLGPTWQQINSPVAVSHDAVAAVRSAVYPKTPLSVDASLSAQNPDLVITTTSVK